MSPWHGQTLDGVVRATYLHGGLAYRRGEPVQWRTGRELLA